jgi:hypothetical protein
MRLIILACLMVLAASADAHGHRIKRSHAAIHAFMRAHHCPSTGKATGKCPGYIVDHVVPLCAGGADKPENMQWQTVADAKAKDKLEWAQCRSLRQAGN